jgi:hypothetical protein
LQKKKKNTTKYINIAASVEKGDIEVKPQRVTNLAWRKPNLKCTIDLKLAQQLGVGAMVEEDTSGT